MPTYFDKTELPILVTRVRDYVREEALWETGASLLLAVSGGPDSVVLLDTLAAIAPEAELRLAVAHIHHGLRAEAEDDASFVKQLAARYGLPFHLHRVDVPARVAGTGESVEEAARELRYAALREIAAEVDAIRIVTGHTADDQAETVLMRLLRGTGLTGLAGIPPQRGEIVRPLLHIWRGEIMAYVRDRELAYRTDISNYSTDFTRNRVRLDLLPHLETEYAPRLRARLHHLAELARVDANALDAWAGAEYARLRHQIPDGIALPPSPDLPRAVIWRLWRRAIEETRGRLVDIGYDHLRDIHDLAPGQQVHLPGVRVVHERAHLAFIPSPEDGDHHLMIPEETLPMPGRICLLDAACCLTTERLSTIPSIVGGDTAVLDAARVQGHVTLRGWRPGDRFRPFGAPGERKLQDIFVDAGVPRRLRERIPVILDEEGIVWLAGFRIADRVKVSPATTDSLRIHIEWEFNPWTLQPSPSM